MPAERLSIDAFLQFANDGWMVAPKNHITRSDPHRDTCPRLFREAYDVASQRLMIVFRAQETGHAVSHHQGDVCMRR